MTEYDQRLNDIKYDLHCCLNELGEYLGGSLSADARVTLAGHMLVAMNLRRLADRLEGEQ